MTVIAVTPGEPAGVGPELLLALARRTPHRLVAVADPDMLEQRAGRLGLDLVIAPYDPRKKRPDGRPLLEVLEVRCAHEAVCGHLDPANAPYVLDTLTRAGEGCLRGEFDALVTGPVHKGIINDAGIPFTGHTEFLARLCGVRTPVMLLAAGTLRVALATTHLPLKDVPGALTRTGLEHTIRVLVSDLDQRFGLSAPRVIVCGLNPHAGEGGHLGTEEQEVISPVIEKLRAEGFSLQGPVPADTAFTPGRLATADAVLAMYHDQGLPVLKHAGFGEAVNVTLGLPIVRTSVDHGTALDLAGAGRASADSLAAAVDLAVRLTRGVSGTVR